MDGLNAKSIFLLQHISPRAPETYVHMTCENNSTGVRLVIFFHYKDVAASLASRRCYA